MLTLLKEAYHVLLSIPVSPKLSGRLPWNDLQGGGKREMLTQPPYQNHETDNRGNPHRFVKVKTRSLLFDHIFHTSQLNLHFRVSN